LSLVLSVISLLVALAALTINLTALLRWPRIAASWGEVQTHPPYEGLTLTVTARRRAVEVDEVGIVMLSTRPYRRRIPEWVLTDDPIRLALAVDGLPTRLQDGESIRGFIDTDTAAERLHHEDGTAYTYVRASGFVYFAPDFRLRRRLRKGR